MDNGINFWLGFLIIITSCLTQELTTAEYLTRNIRNEEPTTTDSSINNSSISHLEELIDFNQVINNETQINNGSDYVNDNFIDDQIAIESRTQELESKDKTYKRGSVKYKTLPHPLSTEASALSSNISPEIDSDISNSTLNPSSTSKSIKENKNSSPNRSEYSRSYEKYTSPEFQSINNVYKYEVSPEIVRYTSSELYDEISSETKSNGKTLKSNIFTSELTTPTTLTFDNRHYNIQKEIIYNIKENDDLTTTNMPNIIEIIKPRVNKTIDYQNIANIEQIDSINAASRHSKLIIENSTSLNIESKYLTNKTFFETTLSPKVNELDYLTVTPIKNRARFSVKTIENDHKTTTPQTVTSRPRFSVKTIESDESNEKNTIIKKPIWKPHYLSTQTPTSINPVYESLQKNTTNITKRGSIKYTDTLGTTTNAPETTTVSDSIVQENQQHSVRILPPDENIFDILSTTEDPISTTTIDNPETTTSETLFDVEIIENTTYESVTTDANSFTVEIDLTTTDNPSTTESTTKFSNRISLLESISTTPPNYEFSTELDLSTTTERILMTTINNNETIVTTNLPDVTTEATSTETSTFLPEGSTVTTNIIPITLSVLESNASSTTVPNSYVIKNKSLSHEDDNLSFINQQSSENTIKPGKSNYLTPTSEEDDDIKVKFPTESTTAQSVAHSSSILTTINYKNIDDNILHETINKKSKPTTSLPTPLSSSTVSHVFETTTFGYDYKYGHKTSENNVYKHFSTADENNIHTNAPDVVITSTTTEIPENTMDPLEDDETNPITIIAIIIITIAAICLVLLALLLIIMRKRQKRFNYGQRCTPVSLDAYSLDSVSVYNSVRRKGAIRASKRSYGNPAFEDTENISHPMNFSKLANFAHNEEGIAKEYEDIPVITAQASEVPLGCESKNRYANVIPLPETRVYLTKIEGDINSDYINANFIRGPKNSKAFYIATQAPLENTIDDFWRMIWEQQSKLVIQVTDLYENGVEKCFDYLPPSEVLDCHRQFGDFQITLKKREVKEKFIIHSIQLKNMVSNSWREITHLWYLGWPERGVPSEVDSIIAFLIEARSYTKTNTNSATENDDDKVKESANGYLSNGEPIMGPTPIVVHCSPGTGRTGTIITCDILMREFELTRVIDVPKIVYRIRRDRAGAVQTKDQYAYIYKVINVYATKLTGGALDSI